MKRISASTHIAVGITFLTMSLIMAAEGLGIIPSPAEAIITGRKQLCESLAIQCSMAAQNNDIATIQNTTQAIVERNRQILSAALRGADGVLVAQAGNHPQNWKDADSQKSTPTHVRVPISKG